MLKSRLKGAIVSASVPPSTFPSAFSTQHSELLYSPHAHWHRRSRPHLRPVREPELPRVVRVLRGQRVREPPRARIQRHPQRGRAHRRLAALQIHDFGTRRRAAGRSADHPRRVEDGRRPGVLHAVVRRARQGHRRWDGVAARRAALQVDRRRSEPALVPAERRRPARQRRGRVGGDCRAGAAGADVSARAAGGVRRRPRRR